LSIFFTSEEVAMLHNERGEVGGDVVGFLALLTFAAILIFTPVLKIVATRVQTQFTEAETDRNNSKANALNAKANVIDAQNEETIFKAVAGAVRTNSTLLTLLVLAVVGLFVWQGITNYRQQRHMADLMARISAPQNNLPERRTQSLPQQAPGYTITRRKMDGGYVEVWTPEERA
jgi:high-affinity nickel permease